MVLARCAAQQPNSQCGILHLASGPRPLWCWPAGSYGRTVLDGGEGELALEWWQVGLASAWPLCPC